MLRRVLRLLKAEIVIGFLIATVVWIGVLGWQAAYAPTEIEKQKCQETAEREGRKTEECKSIWEKTTTDPVAFFNLWLVIFTGGLTISTVMLWLAGEKQIEFLRESSEAQSRDMQASIEAARVANKLALDAFIVSQRPRVIIQAASTGESGTGNGMGGLTIGEGGKSVGFALSLKNIGNGPAHNVSITARIDFLHSGAATSSDVVSEALRNRVPDRGLIIFPEKTEMAGWHASAGAESLHRAIFNYGAERLINPIITGCIIYDFPPYQMNCMTTFQFMVRKRGVTLGIPADAGGIQGEDLTLTPIPIANVAT